jgi:DNA-binding NarL/FixJ family response regulator
MIELLDQDVVNAGRMHSVTASGRLPVTLAASDPLTLSGLVAYLRARPEVQLVDGAHATVVVLAGHSVTADILPQINAAGFDRQRSGVLIVDDLDRDAVDVVLNAGIRVILRRRDVKAESLILAITTASAGEAWLPTDLLAALLDDPADEDGPSRSIRRTHSPQLTSREVEVWTMIAEGLTTASIARRIRLSERTVKNVVESVTTRYHLVNRTHAVGFLILTGLLKPAIDVPEVWTRFCRRDLTA